MRGSTDSRWLRSASTVGWLAAGPGVLRRLAEHHFLLTHRPDHLTPEDHVALTGLLETPAAAALRTGRAFLEDWYAIWRDNHGGRRSPTDTWTRYHAWRANPDYLALPPLKRAVDRIDAQRCAKLARVLEVPTWEATNNGAERMGRLFRHRQAPHFRLRTASSIDDSLRSWAMTRRREATELSINPAARAQRGRTPRRQPAMVA